MSVRNWAGLPLWFRRFGNTTRKFAMKLPVDLFINNEFRPAIKRTPQINPHNEEPFAEVASAEVSDLNTAIESADKTFRQTWRDLTAGKPTEILFKIAAGIRANA